MKRCRARSVTSKSTSNSLLIAAAPDVVPALATEVGMTRSRRKRSVTRSARTLSREKTLAEYHR